MDWSQQEKRFGKLQFGDESGGQAYGQQGGTQTQPKKKKRNFWLDQISTVTGTLGGIGGGILGAGAAGVGAIPGAVVGGAGGAGLGEAIENWIDPQSGDKGNILEEAVLGGVFAGGPIKIGKTAFGAATALKAGAGVGVKEALSKSSAKVAGNTIRGTLGKKALESGDGLIAKQFRFTPSQLTNFSKRHGEDAVSVIKRYGIQSADDVAHKGINPLQSAFDEVITEIPSIGKTQLQKQLTKAYKPLINSSVIPEQQLGKQLQAQADEIIRKAGDTVDAKSINSLRKSFDSFVAYTAKGSPEHNATKKTADILRGILQKQADKAGLGYQGKTFKEIGKDLSKLYDLQETVARQANVGRGSLPLSIPNLLGGAIGSTAGPAGAVGGIMASAALNSGVARRTAAKGATKIGGRMIESGSRIGQKSLTSPLRMGARIGGASLARDALTGNLAPDVTENEQTLEQSLVPPNTQTGFGNQQQPTPESTPYGRENLMYDIQRDPENADKYIEYYSMLQEVFSPEAEQAKPLSQGQQERTDLIQALDNTEGIMGQGSINYGPINSRVEGIKSVFNAADPETLAYKNTVSGLRAAITKARAGASLTAGELKMLAQYTPSDTDSEQVVRSKLQQLRALYGYQAPAGGTTLEDALVSRQQAY